MGDLVLGAICFAGGLGCGVLVAAYMPKRWARMVRESREEIEVLKAKVEELLDRATGGDDG